MAALAGCDPRDVVLTSGGTEANNLALRIARSRGERGTEVLVTSRLEHPSVTRVAEALEREGAGARAARRGACGRAASISRTSTRALAGEGDVRLVAMQAVNSETGVVQPVEEAMAIAGRARAARRACTSMPCRRSGALEDSCAGADTRSLGGAQDPRAEVDRRAHRRGPGCKLVAGAPRRAPRSAGIRPGTTDPVAAAGLAVAARARARRRPARYGALAPLRDALRDALGSRAPRRRALG